MPTAPSLELDDLDPAMFGAVFGQLDDALRSLTTEQPPIDGFSSPRTASYTTGMLPRVITLPIEAGAALRETLGILDDHSQAEDPYRAASMEQKIWQAWDPDQWEAMRGPDAAIEFDLEDAALILHGLAFTEMMSVELPWFDMVQWTVDFITTEIRPQWTDEEWQRLSGRSRPFGNNPFR